MDSETTLTNQPVSSSPDPTPAPEPNTPSAAPFPPNAPAPSPENPLLTQARERLSTRDQELRHFLKTYPDVKAETIPKAVWRSVAAGQTLTNAYTMYQNEQLKAELAALDQAHSNAAHTPGSMSSGGERGKKSISDWWDEAGE